MDQKFKKTNQLIFLIDYRLILLLLTISPLYLFNSTLIKDFGIFAILAILVLVSIDFFVNITNIKINRILVWFIIVTFLGLVMLVRTMTASALYAFILQTGLLLFLTALSRMELDEPSLNKIFKWGKVIFLVFLIPSLIIALEGGRAAFARFNFLYNPVIYKIMLPSTFFVIAKMKYKIVPVALIFIVYLRMVERTTAFVLLIIFFTYLIIKLLRKSKALYITYFIIVFVAVFGFTLIYMHLNTTDLGVSLNQLFREYTGGNFFSGRDKIWLSAFEYIKTKPIIGFGIDNGILRLAGITKSTHNTYIHLLLQGGFMMLVSFFMFLLAIWVRFFDYLENEIVALSASYLVGILVYINFEVTLVGNSTVVALFMWFVLSIGLIVTNNLET